MVGQHFIERHYGKGVENLVPAPVKATQAVTAAHTTPDIGTEEGGQV